MRVLMITGDKTFKAGHPRFDVQATSVQYLEVLYWGAGALVPRTPQGTFDVITTQDPFFRGLVGLWLKKKYAVRLNVQVHADLKAQSFFKRLIAQFVLAHADSVRVVSEKVKVQVQHSNAHVPITVLPVYIDVSRFKEVVRQPNARPTILWVGRFEDEKDPLRALRVLRAVRLNGIDAALVMLGSGSLEKKLKVAARGLPVEFPGYQDTAPFLENASVVLSTSRAESFGASIIEALAAGVPVVAPDVGIAREAGATVAPREHLADAVCETLLTHPKAALKITLLSKDEWSAKWKQSLVLI